MNRYDQKKIWSDFRVGSVTFLGIFFFIFGVVFAGGDKGLIFHSTTFIKARTNDVGGLKKGSSVSIGGMTVGRVTDIAFMDGKKNQIEVKMQMRSDALRRIKTDSVPVIRTQGMLGDRYIDITRGTDGTQPFEEGQLLLGEGTSDFDKTLYQAGQVLTQTEKLLNAVNDQKGSAGQFIYDEKLYKTLAELSAELKELIQDFKKHPRKYIKFSVF